MAVLTNTMMQGTAAISDDAYQIEKGLRFDEGDSAHLLRTIGSKGNRRTWTWAAWVKRWDVENRSTLFSAGDGQSDTGWTAIEIETDEKLKVTGWNTSWKQTNRLFRDPSAWFHIVVAFDTTQATATDRCKVYINGKLETSFSADNSLTQNTEYAVNEGSKPHRIGGIDPGGVNNGFSNFYLADNYLIDGLALSPAAFGSFDDAGIWNPKTFALPAPNTDNSSPTWSNQWESSSDAGSTGNVQNDTKLFDGNETTYAHNAQTNTYVRWVPSSPISYDTLEIKFGAISNGNNQVFINGVVQNVTSSGGQIYSDSNGTLSEIKLQDTGSTHGRIFYIKINGTMLEDGKTDLTTRSNPNNGTVWSNYLTASDGSVTNATNMNGDHTTYFHSGQANTNTIGTDWVKFTPPTPITVEQHINLNFWDSDHQQKVLINDTGSWLTPAAANFTKVPFTGTLTSIKISSNTNARNAGSCSGIGIDGHMLLDSSVDNSFHLKFNDTSSNAAIGYSSIGGVTFDATTAALPIYNTDTSGRSKESGYRTDSNSSTLALAIPGDSFVDEHDHIKGSGSPLTITSVNGAVVNSDTSRFYGSSTLLDGSDDIITISSNDVISDQAVSTVEMWVYFPAMPSNNVGNVIFTRGNHSSNNLELNIFNHSGTNKFYESYSSGTDWTGDSLATNTWYHVAQVIQGSSTSDASATHKIYVDGVLRVSNTVDLNSPAKGSYVACMGARYRGTSATQIANFRFNDCRFYTSAKYTANFTPPTTTDFTVTNLTTGVDSTLPQGTTVTITGWDDEHENIRDGDISTSASGYNGGTPGTVTFSPAIPNVIKVRLYSQPYKHYLNGTDVSSTAGTSSGNPGWYTLYDNSSTAINLTSCGNAYTNGTQSVDLRAIEINGVIQKWGDEHEQDVLNDTPTNYESGGTAHGNFSTWNPLTLRDGNTYGATSDVYTKQGNLEFVTANSNNSRVVSTMPVSSGKYYCEISFKGTKSSSFNWAYVGIIPTEGYQVYQHYGVDIFRAKDALGIHSDKSTTKGFKGDGTLGGGGTDTAIGSSSGYDEDDVIGIAIDCDTPAVTFYKNGTTFGTYPHSMPSGKEWLIYAVDWANGADITSYILNTGQRPFLYTPPTGFKSICTQNLDDLFSGDNVNNPSKYFDVKTWSGTGADRKIPLNFGPELVWTKRRSGSGSHRLSTVLDWTKHLTPDTGGGEVSNQLVDSIASDGVNIDEDDDINNSSHTFVGWFWDVGTTAATVNTAGSLDPSAAWVNATSGVNILKYTGGGAAATIGHNLGAKPDWIIVKALANSYAWETQHTSLGAEYTIQLQSDAAKSDQTDRWNDTEPTNSVFSVGNSVNTSGNGVDFMAFLFTAIPGFSKFGHYIGTGSSTNFIYLGFKPKWFILKPDATDSWRMFDIARSPNANPVNAQLQAQGDNAELAATDYKMHFNSNGIELQASLNSGINGSGTNFYYAAFAEHPFKTARAR